MAESRIVLTWYDLFFVLLASVSGLALSQVVTFWVDEAYRNDQPREEKHQLQRGTQEHQRELAAAQAHIAALRTKLHELRLQMTQEKALREASLKSHPSLATAVGSAFLGLRSELAQNYLQARMEQDAASRLSKLIEKEMAAAIDDKAKFVVARARAPAGSEELLRAEIQVAEAEARLQALLKKSSEHRLELARLETRVEAVAASYPPLAQLAKDGGEIASVFLDGAQLAVLNPTRPEALSTQQTNLRAELSHFESEAKRLGENVLTAQHDAENAYHKAHQRWMHVKLSWTGVFGGSLVAVLWIVACIVGWFKYGADRAKAMLPWHLAFGILLVCYFYELFGVGGATIAALAVLVVVRWRLESIDATAMKGRPR